MAPAELLFPQFVDGGGYTTQLILFTGDSLPSAGGTLLFFDSDGRRLDLPLTH